MFGAIAGGIASALAGGAMSKLFGSGQTAAFGGIQRDVLATDNNTVFFFSSRRRHTRSLRDWSSDVCSSDFTHTPTSAPARVWVILSNQPPRIKACAVPF